jgi:hypothetical protein
MKTITKTIGMVTAILLIAYMCSLYSQVQSLREANFERQQNEIIYESNIRIQGYKQAALLALDNAAYHSGEAEKYKGKMETAESDAAEKDKLRKAEREKRKEVEEKLDIILADPPCKDLDFGTIDFEKAKLKIMALCKIGEYQEELKLSLEYDINHLEGIVADKNKALSGCKKMAGEYQAEAALNLKAATDRLKAINEFENVTVPALEKKVELLQLKKLWKYVKWFFVGAGTGAAAYAVFKK